MKISYCNDCLPTKPALATGAHDSVTEHKVGGATHTNIASIDVDDDLIQSGEALQVYLDRLTSTYQSQFV